MLSVHRLISNLPLLLFHGAMYKLLFHSHYEPVPSPDNRRSGSDPVLFPLFWPPILITVLGTWEDSRHWLADCLWISRQGKGLGAS